MFFTRLGRFVAVLVILLGALQILLGMNLESEWLTPYRDALSKYTPTSISADPIDSGIVKILLGIALGMLAEIRAGLDY